MFCENCGRELPDNARSCSECGAPAPVAEPAEKPKRKRKPTARKMMSEGSRVTPNIVLCEDGKYRWIYEMGLFRNPTIFLLVWKIFFFITLGIFAMVMFFDTVNGYMDGERLLNNLKVMGYMFIGMTVLVALGYALYAAVMGGKYIVQFEMDDKGIDHKQIAKQAEKARKLGRLTSMAGAASGSLTAVGVGMNAQRTEMYSEFAGVRKVKLYPRRHLIKLNGRLSHNQVYAAAEDYEFVRDFILSRCDNLKNKEKS